MVLLGSCEEFIEGFGGVVVEFEKYNSDAADLFPAVSGVPDNLGTAGYQLIPAGTPETEIELLSDVEHIGGIQEHARAGNILGVGSDLAIAAANPYGQTGHHPDRSSGPDVNDLGDGLAKAVLIVN